MIKDLKQVNVPNEIIAQLNTLQGFEIDTVIALYGEINKNIAKLQIIKKDNSKYYQDNVSVDFDLKNSELKRDTNYSARKNLIDVLMSMSDMLYPVELEKVNNTTVKVKYSCSIKDKEIGKMYDEGDYTKINLENLSKLKSKFEKMLYILMFKHSNVGLINMNLDTLADILNSNVSAKSVFKARVTKAINNISALLDNDKVQLVNSLTWETENITGHDRIKGIKLSFNKLALNNKVSNNKKKETKVTQTRNVADNDEKDKEIAMLKAKLARKERQVEELTKLVANQTPVQGPTEKRLHVIPLETRNLEKKPKNPEFEKEQEEYDKLPTWEKFENEKELDDFSDLSDEHQKELNENAQRAKVALETDDDGFHCFDTEFGDASGDDFDFKNN